MDGTPQVPTTREGFVVTKLSGVYNIDDTALGRMAFSWAGSRGRKRCALYEMTHKNGKAFREWEGRAHELMAPIEFYSRDNRPLDIEVVSGGKPPCIVTHTSSRLMLVVPAAEIEACDLNPAQLVATINAAIPKWSLTWA